MAETIQSNEAGAAQLASSVKESLSDYLGFSLTEISSSAPVSGSNSHDGLSNSIKNAMIAWNDLVVSDANALVGAASELESMDSSSAQLLLGVGGDA